MLTYNIDTCDSLTNGTFGEIRGIELDQNNEVSRIIVQFDNDVSGRERRKNCSELQQKYKPLAVTPIDKIEFQYSLSKKTTRASSNATAIQFPLKLAFAATAHKIQGSTVRKPNFLVLDLRRVMEAAQTYVMLCSVQSLNQLFILESIVPKKIYASDIALNELNRMTDTAIQNKKTWNTAISCNIRSLSHNFQSFITTPNILKSDVICLQETWLTKLNRPQYSIEGFEKHFNSVGRGKGIVTYFRDIYSFVADVKKDQYQMTKVSSNALDVINIYRSSNADSTQFLIDFSKIFDFTKPTLVLGDFNICWKLERTHSIMRFMEGKGFQQLVSSVTHMEGRQIDQVFLFDPENCDTSSLEVTQQSSYFSDHDILYVYKVENHF